MNKRFVVLKLKEEILIVAMSEREALRNRDVCTEWAELCQRFYRTVLIVNTGQAVEQA